MKKNHPANSLLHAQTATSHQNGLVHPSRIYWIVILTFCVFNRFICQESPGSFYWQVYPNYTFARITKNDPKINPKIVSTPLFGLGLGYSHRIAEKLRADVSLSLHGVTCRFKSIPINNFEMTYVPMISGSLYFTTKPNLKGHFLFLSLGGHASYEVGSQTVFIISDTASNRTAILTTERENIFNFFGSMGLGAYFKRDKRDIFFGLQFSNGFRNAYKATITTRENQNDAFSELVSKDTFLSFQCKFFFKKFRKVKGVAKTLSCT